ncbi:MAG TPA: hypothetical protein VHI71_08705 [Actinomycetota bacterium]|nr:hypothetical protein [Actinomycetota bacterium]
MKDLEAMLAVTLAQQAERLAPQPGHRAATMRRARRRRTANATVAGVMVVGLAVAGAAAIRAVTPDSAVPPAGAIRSGNTTATAGPYGFWSRTSPVYPYVARGWFRGGEWALRAAAVRLAPNADVRLTFQLSGTRRFTTSTYVRDYDDPLFARYVYGLWRSRENTAVVFGAADPAAKTVDVSFRNGETIQAHVFTGYDPRTTLEAGYYLAFVPSDTPGEVVARDGDGRVIAREVIPPRRAVWRTRR